MTDDFYIPPVTTAPAPLVLTDDEKRTRRNRVLSFAVILLIIAIYLAWNGNMRESAGTLGGYSAMVVVATLGYYSGWKPKR